MNYNLDGYIMPTQFLLIKIQCPKCKYDIMRTWFDKHILLARCKRCGATRRFTKAKLINEGVDVIREKV